MTFNRTLERLVLKAPKTRRAPRNCRMTAIVSICALCLFAQRSAAQDSLSISKRFLSEKLDSIEVEKQLHKRKGESIEELEKAAESLKDSIAAIRGRLPASPQPAESAPGSGLTIANRPQQTPGWTGPIGRYLPKTFFDWMVDVVGLAAIISGIVLVFGIVGMFSRRFRKKNSRPSAQPLRDTLPHSAAARSYEKNAQVAGRGSEEDEGDVAALRRRVEGVPDAVEDPLPKDPFRVKARVVRAARQGLDNQEIARRFHLSVDEVSLILRISRGNDPAAR